MNYLSGLTGWSFLSFFSFKSSSSVSGSSGEPGRSVSAGGASSVLNNRVCCHRDIGLTGKENSSSGTLACDPLHDLPNPVDEITLAIVLQLGRGSGFVDGDCGGGEEPFFVSRPGHHSLPYTSGPKQAQSTHSSIPEHIVCSEMADGAPLNA